MLPLKSLIPRRAFPIVTLGLIALNVYVFVEELTFSHVALNHLLGAYGLVPERFASLANGGSVTFVDAVLPLISSLFLHADWLHIIGNMWFLWIFGANVEDRLGHIPFLVFYFVCGIVAGLTHVFFNWGSSVPTIGASGAISGVVGAFLILFPVSRILTLVPIIIIPLIFEIPAIIFIAIWFALQLFGGLGNVTQHGAQTIAWWAHVGGFAMGILLAFQWKKTRTPNYYYG